MEPGRPSPLFFFAVTQDPISQLRCCAVHYTCMPTLVLLPPNTLPADPVNSPALPLCRPSMPRRYRLPLHSGERDSGNEHYFAAEPSPHACDRNVESVRLSMRANCHAERDQESSSAAEMIRSEPAAAPHAPSLRNGTT